MATKRPSDAGTIRPGPLESRRRPDILKQTAVADREGPKPGIPSQNDRGSRIYGPASRRG